jgi:hypothetical protein
VSFIKRILVGWLSGGWTQKCWRCFGWRRPWLGKRAVPLLYYTLAFELQLTKITENVSQCSRAATGLLSASTCLPFEGQPRLACCTSVHLGYRVTSVSPRSAQCVASCSTKRFPASADFGSKVSVSALMWPAKNGIPKSWWICPLPMYQGALVAVRRHLDCKTCSFWTRLQADRTRINHQQSCELRSWSWEERSWKTYSHCSRALHSTWVICLCTAL